MKKHWRLLGSSLLLGLVAWRVDWGEVGAAFGRTYWPLCIAALAVYAVAQIVSSLRWQLLAGALGFGGSLARYTRDYFIGNFFNLVLPTSVGGDVVRAWNLAHHDGEAPQTGRRAAAAVSVLADRVNGVCMLIVQACLALLVASTPLPGWMRATVLGLGFGMAVGLAGLPLARPLLRRVPGLADRLPQRLRRLLDATLALCRRPALLAFVTALSLVVQMMNAVLVGMLGEALGLPIPWFFYGMLVPLVSLLTLLPISLNGMGLREAGMVMLLAPLGISAADALTLSLLSFGVYLAAGAAGGLLLLTGAPRTRMVDDTITDESLPPARAA